MNGAAPLRVAYDISVIAASRENPLAQTGIYRAVDHVARSLQRSGECELAFLIMEGLGLYVANRDVYACDAGLGSVPVHSSRRFGTRTFEMLQARIRQLSERQPVSTVRRVTRRLLAEQVRVTEHASRLWLTLDRLGVDILHSPFHALPSRRARAGLRAPCFLTVYDLIPLRFPEHCMPNVIGKMKSIYRSLTADDWALTSSECTRADLLEFRPDLAPARVFVTPLAAETALFHPVTEPEVLAAVRRRYGVPEGPYLLSLNTLEPRKNLDHLVRAFAALVAQEQVPDLHLVLVGAKGWKTEGLFAALAESGVARDRVILTGFVADEDLAALYSGALGFVYPSLYEGFGLPPLEAMQCGVPVIASNTSSLPEVVGDAGILLDPTDGDALAQAMLDLYQNAALHERLQAQSLARAATFSWSRCADQTIAAYRTALAS